jgi:hypothetical protein
MFFWVNDASVAEVQVEGLGYQQFTSDTDIGCYDSLGSVRPSAKKSHITYRNGYCVTILYDNFYEITRSTLINSQPAQNHPNELSEENFANCMVCRAIEFLCTVVGGSASREQRAIEKERMNEDRQYSTSRKSETKNVSSL